MNKETAMQRKLPILTLSVLVLAGTATLVTAAHHRESFNHLASFEELDANGDQMISPQEMKDRAQVHFNKNDTNNDGLLSAEEITAMHMAQATAMAKLRQADMIEKLDKNNDGLISFEELQADHRPLNSDKIFRHLDKDDDGMISAEEFASAREHGHKGKRKNKP